MKDLILAAAFLPMLAGCVAGPGNKPGTMRLKVFKDVEVLPSPQAVIVDRGIRYELIETRREKTGTLLGPKSWRLQFEFKVTNITGAEINLSRQRPQASLTLSGGGNVPPLVWMSQPMKLPAGQSGKASLFNDNSVPKGASPAELIIAGQSVRWYPAVLH